MIGMSVGYRRNLHYGVDFLVAKLPKKYAIVLKRIVYFLMLLTCVLCCTSVSALQVKVL